VRDGGKETIYLVNASSDSAQFNYTGGSCVRCNWGFELLEGNNSLSKMVFTNIQATSGLLNVGGTFYINDTILT